MTDTYMDHMTRLPSEVQRLNDQFDSMTENIGYILHPSVTLPHAPRIIDIGTGTARFLLRLQPTYPEAKLEGFDISSSLFPPQSTLPPNVFLAELDMKQPFPEHMHEKYDLIHVRMLVAAMLPNDSEATVRNLTKLLKPGGLLYAPSSRIEKTKYIGDAFRSALRERFMHGWNTLPDHMRASGLTLVVSDVASSDRVPETREQVTTGILNLVFTWAHAVVERGASKTRFENAVRDEIRSGCYFKYDGPLEAYSPLI
ncbi:S-adenosyl-L-methionine-dependent methyltransferase [Hypoxylon rubiginosum]|uniref:S-adenosyl-L-methionine-dependent methyltransferase n=1 Tax=Hypoxylon rubiginosum TaxID=110542 RepID=A0ACB9YNP0_9PEZI|nr:S-adenosyl-L-methionine-dependent methyltransferase [Hypoxylon rubiginosum]